MLEKNQLETLLSLCLDSKADFAEIFEEETTSESINLLNGIVEDVDLTNRKGIGIRIYCGCQSVYGYTNDLEMESLIEFTKSLKEAFGNEQKNCQITFKEETIENKHKIEINPFDVELKDKVKLLKKANRYAHCDARIFKVQCNLLSVCQHVQISNTKGKLVQDTRIRTRLPISVYAKENDKMQSGFEGPGASSGLEYFSDEFIKEKAREASRVALVNLEAKDCPSGKMPVIIDNGFGGVIFHEACGHALEASAVSKNQSVFANKLNTQIASSKVTAIDDGTIPNGWGSQNVDDEGNPQQKRVLIKDGILVSYMVDQLNGRRMNMESTGSSRRQSYKYEPTSRMSNTYIAAGDDDFEEMFEGIEKGLYAKKMGGGSVNPQTGEFNFAVNEGYLIENGKITYPVKGATLIGSGAEILMNIDRVGKNLARAQGMCGASSGNVPTDVGQPAIRVSSITVGGTCNE
ncbi:MAG: TldD/PmbA family protein [Erysipelotrichaceae bacterium]|uniref:TldD/PmbA family protein n=1 Tax=Floccifex sp. TaxID=2815810 RepID=UPI002A74FA82|nr:TldD/PmbA family protein [Floccifex sp.]MDD7281337.1 TldD/PmbA family protein [Erysipelotrichaceae bacterium]MDY2958922.1 TldD/PmbA family protein [Floccifex sp.]